MDATEDAATGTSGSDVQPDIDSAPCDQLSVRIRELDVRYRVYEESRLGTRDLAKRGFRGRQSTDVHALKGITVDFMSGESIGIIGSNGSGKSTLLRAIAGLQPKTAGTVLVRGEAHLLGVNAALSAELSGYRNVMLGGLAMGMTQEDVNARMDDVIEFSGLGDAMGRPMKTYSSGMRARLTFSIATLRTPDILLIDEALAVGDRAFRTRSLERIREIQKEANSVIMVTHNFSEIRETCNRVLWLDQGRLMDDGDVDRVIDAYEQHTPAT